MLDKIEIPQSTYNKWNNISETTILEKNQEIYLIHSIGKVASKSIYEGLTSTINRPIYHLHYLSVDTLEAVYKWFAEKTSYKTHHAEIIDGYSVLNTFNKYKNYLNWKIITLIREPISWQISMLFEILDIAYPDITKDQLFNTELFYTLLRNCLFLNNENPFFDYSFYSNWWQSEFQNIFNFDVLQNSFDTSKGWEIYNIDNIDILVIQYEQLKKVSSMAFNEFGISQDFKLPFINITNEKKNGNIHYNHIQENFKLSEEKLLTFYNSRIITHFYNQDQIHSFINKWKL
jgi:hypothetical protein